MSVLKRSRARLTAVLVSVAACGAVVYAQGTSGNITGQVLDPTGLGVPGARVTATDLAKTVDAIARSTTRSDGKIMVKPN